MSLHIKPPVETGVGRAFRHLSTRAMQSAVMIVAIECAACAAACPQYPIVPRDVVFKPTFTDGCDSFTSGTAFICRIPGLKGTFLLTAQDLFGPAGGLDRQFTSQEASETFVVVTALSIADPTHVIISSNCMALPGARASDGQGYDRDLAAYRVFSRQDPPCLKLASIRPKVGEHVFLHVGQP